jgi:hypothetical protein
MFVLACIGFFGQVLSVIDMLSTLAKRRWLLGIIVSIACVFEILIIKFVSQNPDNVWLAIIYIISSIIGAELGINIYESTKNWNRKKKISNTMKQVWEKRKEEHFKPNKTQIEIVKEAIDENPKVNPDSGSQDSDCSKTRKSGEQLHWKIKHKNSHNRTKHRIPRFRRRRGIVA